MNSYSQYFDIDEGYYPEINPHNMKDEKNKWQNTFPHKTFVDLLTATERMLARGTGADKKGLWIEGAYGTGKSRVAWALKSLLDCSSEELCDYFNEYDALRENTDLRDKLLSAKEDKIVTVYRYGSGSILSPNHLITAIYDSVSKALKDADVSYKGEKTLRGKMAEWLSDNDRKDYFSRLLNKPEYRSLPSISGKSVEDIVAQLQNNNSGDDTVDTLFQSLTYIAENEGISAFRISSEELVSWLSDVIESNNLKAIVFVWDEFSSYFKQNKDSLDVLQALVEFSNKAPFYFVIVTHISSYFDEQSNQAYTIICDRFQKKEITLPDNIAFELIAHALKVKEAALSDWTVYSNDLNRRMPDSRKVVAEFVKVEPEVLSKLLPIHPMAALMLKNISYFFASNQRSMFNFIKNEASDLKAFQWYIETHSPDNEDILTIDYLWDFFYEKGMDNHGNGVGRVNLENMISSILGTYSLNESSLKGEEEKTVLKTILMMQAISHKFKDVEKLFFPSKKNLALAFEGTNLQNNRGISFADNLVQRGILFEKPTDDQSTYAAAAVAGDQTAIETVKQSLRNETKTQSLVEFNSFDKILSLSAGQVSRYNATCIAAENLDATLRKILNEQQKFQIRTVVCFARTEEEQTLFKQNLKRAVSNTEYHHIAIIDATNSIMGQEEFEQWLEFSASEVYWREKDKALSDDMKHKATEIITHWKQKITTGSFSFYASQLPSDVSRLALQCHKMENLKIALTNNTLKLYPFSFDDVEVPESLFQSSNAPVGAKFGITETVGGRFTQSVASKVFGDIWQTTNSKYWETQPNLPLSQLKIKIDQFIENALSKDVQISIISIFDELMKYGYLPSNLYAYLTGFLLKEYTLDKYRYAIGDDGDDGGKMTADKLSEFIGECVKHKNVAIKGYRQKYLAIMTKNQSAFIDFTQKVLGIEESTSVERATQRVRNKIKQLGYPLWCYKLVKNANNLDEFLDKLVEISNPVNQSVSSIAEEFGEMLLRNGSAVPQLAQLLTKENGNIALETWIQDYDSGIIYALSDEIGLTKSVVTDTVRAEVTSGDGSWLWDEEVGKDVLDTVGSQYKLLANSNKIFPSGNTIYSCKKAWTEKIAFLKIPSSVLQEAFPELKSFFSILSDIAKSEQIPPSKVKLFGDILETNIQLVDNTLKNALDIFKNEFKLTIQGLTDEDLAVVYSKLPSSSFQDDQTTYVQNLKSIVDKILSDQKNHFLQDSWKKLTNTGNPKEWSKEHKLPIMLLVPDSEKESAERLFQTLLSVKPDAKDIEFSLDFLNNSPEFIENLSDAYKKNSVFREEILGKSKKIIPNTEEVIAFLEKTVTGDIYSWYNNKAIGDAVENLAKEKYYEGACNKAFDKIDAMSAEETKEYLKALIKDNHVVGIEIISKGDDSSEGS